jgi:C1A family cysteine protease
MRLVVFCQLVIISLLFLTGCCKEDEIEPNNPDSLFGTGWNNKEDFSQTIPVAINYGNYQSGSDLPTNIDLTSKFPPIGNQGQLGTCVAWAIGYNNKTYLDGAARNLSPSQLQSFSNQYSPTDLFFSIDPSKRSCSNGTYFEDAFNVLISRGVNTIANVPYDEVCHLNSPGSAATASANRIKNFRRIQGSVNEVKEYLAQGIPVVIGAMVNREFQQLTSIGVLNNLNYTGDQGGHAMVIAGYDDSKSAFRIINSWGTSWGDYGYLWVDYDFLVNKFCVQGGQKSLFVAFNDNTTTINPPTTVSTPDLAALVTSDFSIYPALSPYINARRAVFDVKNVGTQTITASSNWNIYYLWINAFDANNYGIIFRGEFTTSIPQNTYQNINTNYTRFNYNLASGASLNQTILGAPFGYWDYFMPQVSGSYYLAMYVDKGNSNEANQTNNVFYVTQVPKFFNNGYSNKNANDTKIENKYQFEDMLSFKINLNESALNNEAALTPYRQLSNKEFVNAYTSQEIVSFLKYKIKNGGL